MPRTASWVIVHAETGQPIIETFSRQFAASVNRAVYRVVPIGEWLAEVNRRARETV